MVGGGGIVTTVVGGVGKIMKMVEDGGVEIFKLVGKDGEPQATVRWVYDIIFLRKLEQRYLLTLNVCCNEATHGGEVFGSLDTSSTRLSIGIVTKELGSWLLVLSFVPVDFAWICIFAKTWKKILRRLFPTAIFLDGLHSILPLWIYYF